MDLTTIFLIVVVLAAALYAVLIYNNLVRLKHNVSKSWSNIDVSLKQRHEELPKLVDICQRYMRHEQETLQRVVQARGAVFDARGRSNLKDLGRAESELRSGLAQLFAVAERYPDLEANESFRHLAERISQLEETIADRRELYNDSVNLNNVRLEQIPDALIARPLGFKDFELLEFAESRKDVDLGQLFGQG